MIHEFTSHVTSDAWLVFRKWTTLVLCIIFYALIMAQFAEARLGQVFPQNATEAQSGQVFSQKTTNSGGSGTTGGHGR